MLVHAVLLVASPRLVEVLADASKAAVQVNYETRARCDLVLCVLGELTVHPTILTEAQPNLQVVDLTTNQELCFDVSEVSVTDFFEAAQTKVSGDYVVNFLAFDVLFSGFYHTTLVQDFYTDMNRSKSVVSDIEDKDFVMEVDVEQLEELVGHVEVQLKKRVVVEN